MECCFKQIECNRCAINYLRIRVPPAYSRMRLLFVIAIFGLAQAQTNVMDWCNHARYRTCGSQNTASTCNAQACCAWSVDSTGGMCNPLPHDMGTSHERKMRVDKVNQQNTNESTACADHTSTDNTLCITGAGDWRTDTTAEKAHHEICSNVNEKGVEFDITFTTAAQKCVHSSLCQAFAYSYSAIKNIQNVTNENTTATGAAQYYTYVPETLSPGIKRVDLGGDYTGTDGLDNSFQCYALHILSETQFASGTDAIIHSIEVTNRLAVTALVLIVLFVVVGIIYVGRKQFGKQSGHMGHTLL